MFGWTSIDYSFHQFTAIITRTGDFFVWVVKVGEILSSDFADNFDYEGQRFPPCGQFAFF